MGASQREERISTRYKYELSRGLVSPESISFFYKRKCDVFQKNVSLQKEDGETVFARKHYRWYQVSRWYAISMGKTTNHPEHKVSVQENNMRHGIRPTKEAMDLHDKVCQRNVKRGIPRTWYSTRYKTRYP